VSDRICLDWPVVISRMGKPGLTHDNKTVTQYVEFNFYSEDGSFQLLRSLKPQTNYTFTPNGLKLTKILSLYCLMQSSN
jgi:hypothetical protein